MSPTYVFHKIWKSILDSITYKYGLFYLLAAVFTFLIAGPPGGGLDIAWYHFTTYTHPTLSQLGFFPVTLGFFIPILLPLGLYLYGLIMRKKQLQITAFLVAQASFLGLVISTFLKIFTGRIPPHTFTLQSLTDSFQFGFYRGGAFNGWPSSHTTVAFSLAIALVTMYPEKKYLKYIAWAYALWIGFGVSTNIHWLSDAVAGALIGYAIGKAVGMNFTDLSINKEN